MKLEGIIKSARYSLQREIGRGCWGRVFESFDNQLKRTVAIKVIEPTELAREQMDVRQFDIGEAIEKEVQELAACSYVVPRKLEHDEHGVPFFVMPKYQSFLSDVLGGEERVSLYHGLEIHTFLHYMKTFAYGLAEVHHKLQRVHSDLKPDNLAIDDEGNILISDLGTATHFEPQHEHPRDNIGCSLVRAPECFKQGSHPSRASDVWSFGALVYRMMTGTFPFEKEKRDGTLSQTMSEKYKDAAVWNAHIDKKTASIQEPFRTLMRECMYDDARRIPHGQELVERVGQTIERYDYMQPRRRLKRFGVAAAALGIVAALGFGGYAMKQSRDAVATRLSEKENYWSYKEKLGFVKMYNAGERYFAELPDYFELAKIGHWEERVKDRRTAYFLYLEPEAAKSMIRERGTFEFEKLEPPLDRNWKAFYDIRTLGCGMDSWMFSERLNKEKQLDQEFQELKSQMRVTPLQE